MNRIGDSLHHVGANEELVRAFISNGVEFVIVGGLAVAWYCRDRKAEDLDLLINPTPENSARISRALRGLRMRGFSDSSFTKHALQVPLKQYFYAELLTPTAVGPTYSEVASTAVDAKLFNFAVRIASPALLISMKEQAVASAEAQRRKHLDDIECLREHAVYRPANSDAY